MRGLAVLIIFLPIMLHAQTEKDGIKFTNDLTWQQLLSKANKERKFVFVDCYTTWCGPCKLMEEEVYDKKEVGDLFSQHFLSIKIQMDERENDDDVVKRSQKIGLLLNKKFGVSEYPTFLFFSPGGRLINRDAGYKDPMTFISLAKNSMDSNVIHPYLYYAELLNNYLGGQRNYSMLPFLIDTARILNQREVLKAMVKDYRAYLGGINSELLYTSSNIAFLAKNGFNSKSRFLAMFYPDGRRVDQIMKKVGYAQLVIDKLIQREIIDSITREYEKVNVYDPNKAFIALPDPGWLAIMRFISRRFDSSYAARTVLRAKIQWEVDQHEWSLCAEDLETFIHRYSMNANDWDLDAGLNNIVWLSIFLRSVDKGQIDAAILCMGGIVNRVISRGNYPVNVMDTYANLLYKAGRDKEAIEEENETIERAKTRKISEKKIRELNKALNRMEQGLPTWPRYIDKDDFFGSGLI